METGLIFYSGRVIDLMAEAGPDALVVLHGLELALAVLLILLLRPLVDRAERRADEPGALPEPRDGVALALSPAHARAVVVVLPERLRGAARQPGDADRERRGRDRLHGDGVDLVLHGLRARRHADPEPDRRAAGAAAGDLGRALRPVPALARAQDRAASERASDARSAVTARVVDAYTNIETVKLFAHGSREETYAGRAMRRHLLRERKMMRLMTVMSVGLALLNGVLIVAVVGPAIWLWSVGTMSIGEVSAAAALTLRLNGMTGWIMWVTISLFEHMGVMREGMQSISVPHGVTDRPAAPALKVRRGEIAFRGLHHHYGRGRGGLAGIDLTIRPGEKVGLVGRSGAGKSSLVNLLLRFRDPERGRIEIDGQDVRAVTQESLRRAIGVVTQDSSLLHRSVRENILYGNPEASEAEMVAGGAAGGGRRLHPRAARPGGAGGLRRLRRRARREALGRAAAAGGDRAGDPQGRADPGARRGDERARLGGGGGDPGHALRRDGGQDGDRHRAPAVDHRAHGPDRGARRRPDRRAGEPWRAYRVGWPICRFWNRQSGGFINLEAAE
jgi:ATP-binding cassette, subfamily B, multidrug efflux pump